MVFTTAHPHNAYFVLDMTLLFFNPSCLPVCNTAAWHPDCFLTVYGLQKLQGHAEEFTGGEQDPVLCLRPCNEVFGQLSLTNFPWCSWHSSAWLQHIFSIEQIWVWDKSCPPFCHCLVYLIDEGGINSGTTLMLVNSYFSLPILDTVVLILKTRYSKLILFLDRDSHPSLDEINTCLYLISNQLVLCSLFSVDTLVCTRSAQTPVYRCVLSKDFTVADKTTSLLSLKDV